MHDDRTDQYPEWLAARFWAKVDKTDACWLWTASLTGGGYGQMWHAVRRKRMDAHRFGYEMLVGPVPDGLHLDHLCRVRNCVNPAHLEPVTPAENTRRGLRPSIVPKMPRQTHCKRGHELAGDNLYVDPRGRRQCMACRRDALRRYWKRNDMAAYWREYRAKRVADGNPIRRQVEHPATLPADPVERK